MIAAIEAREKAKEARTTLYEELVEFMESNIKDYTQAGMSKFVFHIIPRFRVLFDIDEYCNGLRQYFRNSGFHTRYDLVNGKVNTITIEW